jgi:alanine racemase
MSMLDAGEPVNVVEIDLGAIARNAREIRRLVGDRFVVAALKSNAHGFGLVEVATTVLAAGADAVAVVNLADAIRLRRAGVSKPVMLYAGPVLDARAAVIFDELDLIPTILDQGSAEVLSAAARRTLDFLVKVDVGLQRLGLNPDDVVEFVGSLSRLPRLRFRGLYTHMHAIEGRPEARPYLEWQFGRFTEAIASLERAGHTPDIRLAACSGVMAMTSRMNLNAIDPGRLFYGLLPATGALAGATFQCAFVRLHSRLVQVKEVVRPGYPDLSPFPVRSGMRMGIIPLGRSDGIEALNAGEVLVRGRRVPILARPSLEHTRIDLSEIPEAAVGDEVVIVGRQMSAEITPDEVTSRLAMDPGELAVGLRGSIERRYTGHETTMP